MVGKGDGLGALQMRVARHHGLKMLSGLVGQRIEVAEQERMDLLALIPQIQADIQGDLVVAAAGCMQALAGIAQAAGQFRLYEHVDVLGCGVDGERASLQIAGNALQAPAR